MHPCAVHDLDLARLGLAGGPQGDELLRREVHGAALEPAVQHVPIAPAGVEPAREVVQEVERLAACEGISEKAVAGPQRPVAQVAGIQPAVHGLLAEPPAHVDGRHGDEVVVQIAEDLRLQRRHDVVIDPGHRHTVRAVHVARHVARQAQVRDAMVIAHLADLATLLLVPRVVEHQQLRAGQVARRHAQLPVQRPRLLEGDDEGNALPAHVPLRVHEARQLRRARLQVAREQQVVAHLAQRLHHGHEAQPLRRAELVDFTHAAFPHVRAGTRTGAAAGHAIPGPWGMVTVARLLRRRAARTCAASPRTLHQ